MEALSVQILWHLQQKRSDHVRDHSCQLDSSDKAPCCSECHAQRKLEHMSAGARTVTEYVSEWYVVVALSHKFFIGQSLSISECLCISASVVPGFAVVTVVTGVFLQETFKVAMTDDTIMMRCSNGCEKYGLAMLLSLGVVRTGRQRERQIRSHTKKMNLLFEAADEDENGKLDKEDFQRVRACERACG
eukprot:4544232-Amphidinium_carterae.1